MSLLLKVKRKLKTFPALWGIVSRTYRSIDLAIFSLRIFFTVQFCKIVDLNRFEKQIYCQNGEAGILEAIFRRIGTTNKFYVEFGSSFDGSECNTRFFREKRGWSGILMDAEAALPIIGKEFVTAENINFLFEKYKVPGEFDLLSIDIDGNDYWVWKALRAEYSPRVVVIEYNANVPVNRSAVVEYDPHFRWDDTDYYGASLLALTELAATKGYSLLGCESRGINAFFVRNDLVKDNFALRDIQEVYKPPRYEREGGGLGHHPSGRAMKNLR